MLLKITLLLIISLKSKENNRALYKRAYVRTESFAVDLQCEDSCLNRTTKYRCSVNGNLVRWKIPKSSISNTFTVLPVYYFSINAILIETEIGNFSGLALPGSTGSSMTSDLFFATNKLLDNIVIECESTGMAISDSCTVDILDSPSTPEKFSVDAIASSTITALWSPPINGSHCIEYYAFEIRNDTDQDVCTTVTNTNFTFNEMLIGSEYTLKVQAIDFAGRKGKSAKTSVIWNVPEMVVDLNYTLIHGSLGCGRVEITWKPAMPSMRPPVLLYHVYHNLTSTVGMNVLNITNNQTSMKFADICESKIFTVNISAQNILGLGKGSIIKVTVNIQSLLHYNTYQDSSFSLSTTMTFDLHSVQNDLVKKSIYTGKLRNQETFWSTGLNTPSVQNSDYSQRTNVTSKKNSKQIILVAAPVMASVILLMTVILIISLMAAFYKRHKAQKKSFEDNGASQNSLTEKPMESVPPHENTSFYNCDQPPPIPPYRDEDELSNIPSESLEGIYSKLNRKKKLVSCMPHGENETYSVLRQTEKHVVTEQAAMPTRHSLLHGVRINTPLKGCATIYADLDDMSLPKRPAVPPTSKGVVYSSLQLRNPPPLPKKKRENCFSDLGSMQISKTEATVPHVSETKLM